MARFQNNRQKRATQNGKANRKYIGGITIQIKKKAETPGVLNAYIYLIMDAQLNIQNGAYISAVY